MEGEANHRTPKRVAVFFTAVDSGDLEEVIANLADDGESRGLFFDWAAVGDMELNDVVTGSPLHKALSGEFPDR
jgi:hypothetical protein